MSGPFSYRLLAQTSLRNILGTKNLHEILSDRDSIAGAMQVVTHITFDIHQNKWFLIELAGRGHCRLGNKSGKSRNVKHSPIFIYIVTLMLLFIASSFCNWHLSYSKDARLPENLQRAMAAEAEAAREARAKVKWDFWLTTSFINGCQDKMIP